MAMFEMECQQQLHILPRAMVFRALTYSSPHITLVQLGRRYCKCV